MNLRWSIGTFSQKCRHGLSVLARSSWRHGSLLPFVVINWIFFQAISLGFWFHLAPSLSPVEFLFISAGFASYLGFLCFFVMIPLQAFTALHRRIGHMVSVVVMALLGIYLISDWNLYNQMRMHINGAAVAILSSSAGISTLNLTTLAKVSIVGVILVILGLQILFLLLSEQVETAKTIFKARWVAPVVLFSFALQAIIYVYADGVKSTNVPILAHRIPFYLPIEMRSYTSGFMSAQAQVAEPQKTSLSDFTYGIDTIDLATNSDTPDIFIIAMDSLRADLVTDVSAPNMTKFASGSQTFDRHMSGGNQTRHGIFSLFYGIPSSYWGASLRTHTTPVLMRILKDKGYDIQIFSSANLDHPEFKETVFYNVDPNNIHDRFDGVGPQQRDRQAADGFLDFVRSKSRKPRFGFLFLDGTHGPYSYTAVARKFTPDEASYFIAYNPTGQIQARKNSYLNSIYQVDLTLKEVLSELDKKSKGAKPPVVIMTSDHGEEFLEHGFMGHCSAFTPEQVMVPLMTRGLGTDRRPHTYSHLTSHSDVVYSLLARLGVENAEDLSSGMSLFGGQRTHAMACGWDQCAVISDHHVTVFGTEPYNAMKVERLNGD